LPDPAASGLDDARRELAELGGALGPVLLRLGVGEPTRAQFQEAHSDVVAVALLLGDALTKGRRAWERFREYARTAEVGEKAPAGVGVDLPAVKVLYKAFFFFVRAFQDQIYAVLSERQTGQRAARERG
jgi:hypothetical protein